MTEIPVEGKPLKDITIQGVSLDVPVPYEEGHVLRPNEANTLNQTYHENLRNNFAGEVKDALAEVEENGGSVDVAALQKSLNEYVLEYDFGVSRGGFRAQDPVMSLAIKLAKEKLRPVIKARGIKLADLGGAKLTELAKQAVEKNPGFMAEAQRQLEEAKDVALEDADELLAALKE